MIFMSFESQYVTPYWSTAI